MTPPLGPVRLGRSLTLGLVSSFLVGCCFGPEQVFDARVVRLPGANPAGSIGGFLSVAEASFTTGSSTTNVVDTKKNEEDEPADGEDKEIVVPLRSTKSRGSRTKTRTHKTRSRQNGILRHPAAAATIGLTMMLVGTAIGAGAMLALARQREEQKKAEDTRTAQAAKSLEPKKVVLTADKAAQQQAEGDRYLSQVLVSIGGAFLSSSILRIMGAFHVPFIYTGMTDQGLRAMLHQFTAGSPWSVIIRQSLFAMGLSAASNQFGILLTILVPIAVLALLPLFSLLSQTTETKSPENLGQTYIFANNMMKKTLEKERADRPEDVEKVVSKYFDLIRREAIQRKFYDAGARKALDASERSIKSQLKKRGKDIEAVLDSAQAQFPPGTPRVITW